MPTDTTQPRRTRAPLNGVDTPTLFGTLDVVKGQTDLARFQFRARNRWKSGTLSETTIDSFSGAGGEHTHKRTFRVNADHPGSAPASAVLFRKAADVRQEDFQSAFLLAQSLKMLGQHDEGRNLAA